MAQQVGRYPMPPIHDTSLEGCAVFGTWLRHSVDQLPSPLRERTDAIIRQELAAAVARYSRVTVTIEPPTPPALAGEYLELPSGLS